MATRHLGFVASAPTPALQPPLPEGWGAVPIGVEPVSLIWDDLPDAALTLRIAVATDARDQHILEASIPNDQGLPAARIGIFDIRYGYAYQVHEMPIPSRLHREIMQRGLLLRQLHGDAPVWIFGNLGHDPERSAFIPHMIEQASPSTMSDFVESVLSYDSLQPFGWLEGCVLEGIHAMRHLVGDERTDIAIRRHLDHFMSPDGDLTYETLLGEHLVNDFTTIEALLPFGQIARIDPNHPSIDHALRYLSEHPPLTTPRTRATAEGCYTLAYPLARIGVMGERPELIVQALDHLLIRRDCLVLPDGSVRQRNVPSGWNHYYENWGRGLAWYLLGYARVIELAEQCEVPAAKLDAIRTEFSTRAQVAAGHQQVNGVWSCFISERATGPENSATAGIAAALAIGTRLGLGDWQEPAEKALAALQGCTSPDGLLHGVSQHNAGGEILQRSGYRVYSQMGMGLMAQLAGELATLNHPSLRELAD